jgi:hypothetical protein
VRKTLRAECCGLRGREATIAMLTMVACTALSAVVAPAGAQNDRNVPPLFESREVLSLTVRTDLRTLVRDKVEDAPWRPGTVVFQGSGGEMLERPTRLRTRGLWRLRHCTFPPLRFNFVKDSVKNTVFARQDRPKLATHCRDSDDYEQYLLQEYLIYRVQETLTPYGLKARLARITYIDTTAREDTITKYGVLLEDPDAMAERLGGKRNETRGTAQTRLQPTSALTLAMFQYMIGNTDWSVPGLHNIEIVEADSGVLYAVAYDFDWTGAINARYAEPDPSLGIRSVRQRLWRGICPDLESLQATTQHFLAQRPRILALTDSVPGLEASRAKRMREYFEEFFETIGEPRSMQREVGRVCENLRLD